MRFDRLYNLLKAEYENADGIVESLRGLYNLFSTGLIDWMAGLYDDSFGGFYYSDSAKNTNGFLPDIESTSQVFRILKRSGAISDYSSVPKWLTKRISDFVLDLRDGESGFFYHLQWDKAFVEANSSRLIRDFNAAHNLSEDLGFHLPPLDSGRESDVNAVFESGHYSAYDTERKFLKYLNSLDWNKSAFTNASEVQAELRLITRRQYEDILVEFLNGKQDINTGLFSPDLSLSSRSTFSILSTIYNETNRRIPMPELALKSILEISDRGVSDIAVLSHKWVSICNILDSIRDFDSREEYRRAVSEVARRFPDMIADTAEHLEMFKHSSGAFSYYPGNSSNISQGMPVALPNSKEGDVNATGVAIRLVSKRLFPSLGLDNECVKIFDESEGDRFFSLLQESEQF